jgi:hypothetical protein
MNILLIFFQFVSLTYCFLIFNPLYLPMQKSKSINKLEVK